MGRVRRDARASDPQIAIKPALAGIPPLIKAYLRLGRVVGEGPCVDAAFYTP